MKCTKAVLLLAGLSVVLSKNISAQETGNDSLKLDYRKIYSLCLDADIKPVFSLIGNDKPAKMSEKDSAFKTTLENRFGYNKDKSNYLSERKSAIDSVLTIYHHYWRTALLDKDTNYDSLLVSNLKDFLNRYYFHAKDHLFDEDSIDIYLRKYVEGNGFHTTGFGKTGKLYDLLVWKTEKDTIYSFSLGKEKLMPRVIFMDGFVTLGWEEYATFEKFYPGGWTTNDGLYCVRKAYDLNSENFLISYLAHEGRHFADKKLFPKLSSPDLEYRAKLVELSLAKKTLYASLDFFGDNANYDSENGHSVANYCVIRDLSKALFHVEFEHDKSKWTKISIAKINAAANKLLQANTRALHQKGNNIEKYIK